MKNKKSSTLKKSVTPSNTKEKRNAEEHVTLHLQDTAPKDNSHLPLRDATLPGHSPTAPGSMKINKDESAKIKQLDAHRKTDNNQTLTTNQGTKISDDQNSLKMGDRGPTLLEDFIMREKMTHFDHERIPERIVHARGSAAHGYFELYDSLSAITKADFLQHKGQKTPVFVRFSTVQGSRGSADTVRDIRGWATKFYTEQGVFDLVGNNTPVFFIQDAIKFPDFVHAVKPEPHNEIPQGASAHDSFWDYVSLQPETLHNVLWAMSDRGIPRSYRTMEGFGIHTFRLINAQGKSTFVRFHWKPVAGKASLLWDEAQKLAGKDADFHRRDLWEAIEAGDYPEYQLGLQLIPEEDEFKFDFDLLDATKLIPEALVPVQLVGRMVLNRNPDNFFAETEQVAFHPGHIVPGIDFTNDPLLQGRLFSYTDTQISRLGGPNFHEIPINRPVCPYHNFQCDGMHRMEINSNPANYSPNSLNNNWPRESMATKNNDGFESHQERLDGHKIRERSPSFQEYYSHPGLFWRSQTPIEQQHIIDAFAFELGKVSRAYIRVRVVEHLAHIDTELAGKVAHQLGIPVSDALLNIPAPHPVSGIECDPALSLYALPGGDIKGRSVAILLADNAAAPDVLYLLNTLKERGVYPKLLAQTMGDITASDGSIIPVNATFAGAPSITVDAVIVPDGIYDSLMKSGEAQHYLLEAYRHLKVIGLSGDAKKLMSLWRESAVEEGIIQDETICADMLDSFFESLAAHRIWSRSVKATSIPA